MKKPHPPARATPGLAPSPPPSPAAEDPAAPGRRERKRQQLADHLADTAWDMFQAFGFDAVSMEAIAEAADVAKATLYKHFAVKGALLSHRLHRELAESAPRVRAELAALADTRSRFRAYLHASVAWINEHQALFAPYVRYRLHTMMEVIGPDARPGQRSGTTDFLAAMLRHGQAQGDVRRDVDAAALGDAFHALYLATLTRWLVQPTLDLNAEFDRAVDIFFSGVAREPRR